MAPLPVLAAPSVEDVTSEVFVSHWFVDYVDAGRAKALLPVRHPRRAFQMLRHLHRLPQLPIRPSGSIDGRAIRNDLRQPFFFRNVLGNAVSALPVPASLAEYTSGRPKHALRQKVRAAADAGIRYRVIDDHAERTALIARADEYERTGAAASTRNHAASNEHLVPLEHWLLAEGADGEPLLLAVVAIDGDVALLRYFRTLVFSEHSSVARYGAMPQIIATLSAAGVRVLLEAGRPCWTDNAMRQFQRKLGFRVVRIALDPAESAIARASEPLRRPQAAGAFASAQETGTGAPLGQPSLGMESSAEYARR